MHAAESSDATLVAESLGGNKEAFRRIVERYQTLISSLAYSATGNVDRSEDLAQETFVRAWTQLSRLREPSKLRLFRPRKVPPLSLPAIRMWLPLQLHPPRKLPPLFPQPRPVNPPPRLWPAFHPRLFILR